MKKLIWYFLGVFIVIGLGFLCWSLSGDDAQIETSVSVAEAMSGGNQKSYLQVMGPRKFKFPKDHGPHPGYKTEWWYYTGNLFTDDGRQFGYQFTIFRNQLNPPAKDSGRTDSASDWSSNQLYLGHFAISDVENENHIFEERYSRGAAGLAGASVKPYKIWLDDWEVTQLDKKLADGKNFPVHIAAEMETGASIDLKVNPAKPLTLEGDHGYDRKGAEAGNASYYLSFTRMATKGNLKIHGTKFKISGFSWMDHEWSTSALGDNQDGWDWFSIQLSNGYDLMYYQLRNADGSIGIFTTGSLVSPDGTKTTIGPEDVQLEVLNTWESPHNTSVYPSKWKLSIPKYDLHLNMQTLIPDQEMDVSVRYYEGTVSVEGSMKNDDVGGHGFIEMTGYEED